MSLLGLQGYNSDASASDSDSSCSSTGSKSGQGSINVPSKKKAVLPAVSALLENSSRPTYLSHSEDSAEIEYTVTNDGRVKNDGVTGAVKRSTVEQCVKVSKDVRQQIKPNPPDPLLKRTTDPPLKRKSETTRQKNNRKQKLGQATFTVKAERECPDIWQGGT